MSKSLFYVFDNKYKKWMFQRGEKGRTIDQYWREKMFKDSGLFQFDIEGFTIDPEGTLLLWDEMGRSLYLPPDRFQVCFPKESLDELPDSESGSYKVFVAPSK